MPREDKLYRHKEVSEAFYRQPKSLFGDEHDSDEDDLKDNKKQDDK